MRGSAVAVREALIAWAAVSLAACGSHDSTSSPVASGTSDGGHGNVADVDASGPSSGRDAGGSSSVLDAGPAREAGSSTADAQARADGAADGGNGDTPRCKRGVASNTAPSAAFAPSAGVPGISWWYNWAAQTSGGDPTIEFVPMIWGGGSLHATISPASGYLLGFNEPNFKAQADLTVSQAIGDWPSVVMAGATSNAAIGSPAVNFCGSAANASGCTDPAVTDPYTYLSDFFSGCSGCKVDFVAVHWYNCDLPSLEAYLDGSATNAGLPGFVQFGKPIWLTEFACDTSHSVADQKAYLQAAVPYLENNPHIFRYSWFSASGIPNAELANADGTLTDLGATYVALPQSCP